MIVEIHMIQNHNPANLNRDDLGAPKTCIFGGGIRARISSQCLKRSIRRSQEFSAALEKDGGVRTRRLIDLIAKAASKGKEIDGKKRNAIRKSFENGGVPLKKDEDTFEILFFLPQSAIEEMGDVVRQCEGDPDENELGEKFAEIIRQFVKTPDIALFGRMTEFDAKGKFQCLKGKFSVEAALYAANAISTHEVVNEVDYFTAADDIPGPDAGAAHVNEALFNSACFYKYFVIDFEQLKKNLENNVELALTTVKCFLEGAVKAYPSGKQHAFAAFNPPEGVLVEIKPTSANSISYANAFADPVPIKSERGLIAESIFRLGHYAHDLMVGFGTEAKRFWFSPNLRHRLTWIDQDDKGKEEERSVVDANEYGTFDAFIDSIMNTIKKSGESSEAAR